jgi:hypothetical protein
LRAKRSNDDAHVRFVAPPHCKGEPAFADRYVYAGLGSTVISGAKVIVKAQAGQAAPEGMDAEDRRSYRAAVAAGVYGALLGTSFLRNQRGLPGARFSFPREGGAP